MSTLEIIYQIVAVLFFICSLVALVLCIRDAMRNKPIDEQFTATISICARFGQGQHVRTYTAVAPTEQQAKSIVFDMIECQEYPQDKPAN